MQSLWQKSRTGTIYLEQDWKFVKPVFYGDTITATAEVVETLNKEKGIYKLCTKCVNQDGQITHEGYAIVKYI